MFSNIFCFEKKFINLSYYTGSFLVFSRVHFQNYKRFLELFGYNTRNLWLFVYLRSYTDKSKFLFLQTVVKPQHVLFAKEPFFRKILVYFFSSNIPLHIEKILWKNYVRFWKWKSAPKLVFEKIKFKVLHSIQHDFIR